MRFFCVANQDNEAVLSLLADACRQKKVELVVVTAENFDYTAEEQYSAGDIVYRAAANDEEAQKIEKFLLAKGLTSFYKTPFVGISKAEHVISATIMQESAGLPVIKTVYGLSKDRTILKKSVEYLGGFPIILKIAGGSHGVGVMKADSFQGLRALVDYLISKKENVILRKFIDTATSARLIVLNKKVIDSIEYRSSGDDFRSNEGASPNVFAKKFDKKIENAAIAAVDVLGWEFGGVDVLIDSEDNPHIAEVNLPCYFPRCQMLTGTDIAGMMVAYLVEKAKMV